MCQYGCNPTFSSCFPRHGGNLCWRERGLENPRHRIFDNELRPRSASNVGHCSLLWPWCPSQYTVFSLRYPVDDKESSPDGLSSQLMPVKPEEVYGRDKALFSLILIIYSRAVGVLFLYYNELAQSWNLAGKLLGGYKDYEVSFRPSSSRLLLNSIRKILCSTVFLGILTVVDDIRNLPAMFYDNPDLRQKLGSITTSWWIVVNYPLERWAHPATFASGPLVLVFLGISKVAGDDFILYVMSIWYVFYVLSICALLLPPSGSRGRTCWKHSILGWWDICCARSIIRWSSGHY